jgi:hypothetical protein
MKDGGKCRKTEKGGEGIKHLSALDRFDSFEATTSHRGLPSQYHSLHMHF